jgi:hypothetical protein
MTQEQETSIVNSLYRIANALEFLTAHAQMYGMQNNWPMVTPPNWPAAQKSHK